MKGMNNSEVLTVVSSTCMAGHWFALDGYVKLHGKKVWDSSQPEYKVYENLQDVPGAMAPFKVGPWVTVMQTSIFVGPGAAPWVNNVAGTTTPRFLWVDGNGKFGYSEFREVNSLNELLATIRPVDEIPGFVMVPKDKLEIGLRANEERGWPLERLMALARGEIEVDSLALNLWKQLEASDV